MSTVPKSDLRGTGASLPPDHPSKKTRVEPRLRTSMEASQENRPGAKGTRNTTLEFPSRPQAGRRSIQAAMSQRFRLPRGGRLGGRRIRLFYLLLAFFLITGMVPLIFATWKHVTESREYFRGEIREKQLLMASQIARSIDSNLVEAEMQMLELGSLLQVMSRRGDRQGLTELFGKGGPMYQSLGDNHVLIRYLPERGGRYEVIREGATIGPELEIFLAGEVEAARQGQSRFSNPLALAPGQQVVTLTSPVADPGLDRVHGVLQSLIDINEIWRKSMHTRFSAFTVYGLDSQGNLFAKLDDEGILARANYRNFDLAKQFLAQPGRAKLTSEYTIPLDGVERRFVGSVDVVPKRNWGIFVQVEESAVYSPVGELASRTIKWGALVLFLALFFGVVVANSIAAPINNLAQTARSFARGNFGVRASVRSRNEIGELAETYNRMSDQIQEHIRKLHAAAEENEELFLGTIKALATAIDEKDPYTRGHSDRVRKYSVLIAKAMGLNERELRNIEIGSLLHDMGKIGIDDRILRKPTVLTQDEYRYMKQHPEKGAAMLTPIKNMKEIRPTVRHHHERWDGSGYPSGMKGEEIPLLARIVNVADTFDAMTTNRPYQKAMSPNNAVTRLRELAGSAHDPQVVRVLAELYEQGVLLS